MQDDDTPKPARRATSRRLRFEILRRDNHTCRYCGASAPDAKLTVDHVVPVTLGGTDDPTNLVAACVDCNSGKASVPADARVVSDVAADAIRWGKAIRLAADLQAAQREIEDEYVAHFSAAWNGWHSGPQEDPVPRPPGWADSVTLFYRRGLSVEELVRAVHIAMGNQRIPAYDTFRYMCGVAWKILEERMEIARGLIDNNLDGGGHGENPNAQA